MNDNVSYPKVWNVDKSDNKKGSGDGGGGGSDFEERLRHVETDVAVIRSNYATKDGLQQVKTEVEKVRTEVHTVANRIIFWIVGTLVACSGIIIGAMRLLSTTP